MNEVLDQAAVVAKTKRFIVSNYLFTDDMAALKDDQSLMQGGVMDSTGILELIAYLEETFGIMVADEEMIPDNLDSVNAIAKFVLLKKSSG
jgi:acyl carrier protein